MRCFRKLFAANVAALALIGGAVAAANAARAQDALAPPAPLVENPAPAGSKAGVGVTLAAAQRAQDLGMPSIAADTYRQLRDVAGADRVALTLSWVTALLDAGSAAEAEQALAELPEPHDAAWRLRAGLAALQLGRRDAAQAQWDAIKEREVPPEDSPWYWFFTGALYDTATPRDVTRANSAYKQAENGATTELATARFQLAGEQVRLHWLGTPSPEVVEQTRRNFEQFRGSSTGYRFAEQYAAKLSVVGRTSDAEKFLQREVLLGLPPQETAWRDKFNFLLGLIGDRGRNGAGRAALNQLVEGASDRERQRQALQLLAAASRVDPERRLLQDLLSRLIEAKPEHPIKESLLFYRAQFAMAEKNFAGAELDAAALLKQFPFSALRVHALAMLTQSAWEQQRYLRAADYARQARAEMAALSSTARESSTSTTPSGSATPKPAAVIFSPRARADFGVLEAEASFRAKEYRTAADAYAALLREHRSEWEPGRIGELMFQRVLAEIKAGPGGAGKVLDELARDPAFDVENRWQAEWSLARALNLQGEAGIKDAYARITSLLREPSSVTAALNPELRARMAWLQAKLSFDNGEPAETIRLIEAQQKIPIEISPRLKTEIASKLMLLKARAEFAVGSESVAVETLKRLRADHVKTEAAIESYLIEAEHYEAQDKIDEARKTLIGLTDNSDPDYKSSPYVPYALYRLAMLSERLGREENLKEANQRIEDLVNLPAAVADQTLIFTARLRQGDIFRKRNDYPAAQQAYENLINRNGQRPDVVLAQLALADCHVAQLSNDKTPDDLAHADSAQLIFEQLRDRVDAPRDVQVEAGYKFGLLLTRRGKPDEAARVWWNDVVHPFLIDEVKPTEPDAKRPYWLARTLYELGDLQEKRGRIEEAKVAYLLLLEKRLPFGEAARSRLQQLGMLPPKAGQ